MIRPGAALGVRRALGLGRSPALALVLALALALALAQGRAAADGEPANDAPPIRAEDRDLAELVRRGGRFAEGYVPGVGTTARAAGDKRYVRALGRLILRTLDAKAGTAEAEVFAGTLRDVAEALAGAAEEPLRIPELVLGLARKALTGTRDPDPARAAAHGDVLALVLLAEPPVAASSPGAARIEVGGASLEPGVAADGAPAALLVAVPKGSAAEIAGLSPGDRIRAVAGRPVNPAALAGANARLEAGESVVLTVEDAEGASREVLLAPRPR